MEFSNSMTSVIAKLMGLSDQPPHQPDLKRQRVLSENYLKKSDVIGMYERSIHRKGRQNGVQEIPKVDSNRVVCSITNRIVCSKNQSSRTKHPLITKELYSEELHNVAQDLNYENFLGYSEHLELLPNKCLQDQQLDELCDHSGYYGAEKFLSTARDRNCNTFSNSTKAITPGYCLRSLRKLNKDSLSIGFGELDIYSSPNLLKSRSYSSLKRLRPSTRIVALRPGSGMSLQCTSFTSEIVTSVSGFRKYCAFAEYKNVCENENGKVAGEIDKVSLTSGAAELVEQRNSVQEVLAKRETTVRRSTEKVPSWTKGGRNTQLFASDSSLCMLGGKQIIGKCRKPKISKAVKLDYIRCNVGEVLISMNNERENTKSCNQSSIDKHCCSSPCPKDSENVKDLGSDTSVEGRGSELSHAESELYPCHNLENEKIPGHVICRISNATDFNKDSDMKLPVKGGQGIQDEKEFRSGKDYMLEDSPLIKSTPPCITERMVADDQENNISISPSEFKELLSDTLMKHDSLSQVWETSSTSSHLPVEKAWVSQGFERAADFCGLSTHLQWLNSKSEETCSEGSGLAVSSDEDSEDVSFHICQDTEKILGQYRAEESKNFSYLLDILDKAELTCINSENYLRVWHSSEYPVDPSVFELLEKKYGKQTSWEKSERRLLFDRINAGLKEILNIQIGICSFKISVRRRFIAALGRNEIEEELWMFLTREEKYVCSDSCDKGLGKELEWMQLSEDVHAICREIENDLFDELVGETVTITGI